MHTIFVFPNKHIWRINKYIFTINLSRHDAYMYRKQIFNTEMFFNATENYIENIHTVCCYTHTQSTVGSHLNHWNNEQCRS